MSQAREERRVPLLNRSEDSDVTIEQRCKDSEPAADPMRRRVSGYMLRV